MCLRSHLQLIFTLTVLIFANTCLIFAKTGFFLQITDAHYDESYYVSAPTQCPDGLLGMTCCQKMNVPLPNSTKAMYWGDYKCDTPMSLLNGTFFWINQYFPEIQFILWNGDSANHHITTQTCDDNIASVKTVTNVIQSFFPNIKTYPVIGNHDTFPVDQFGIKATMKKILGNYTLFWKNWLEDASNTFNKYGFYSLMINKNVKLVALNCLIDDTNNVMKPFFPELSDIQYYWFLDELDLSEKKGQTVWLHSHIPPGSSEASTNFTNRLINVMKNYSHIITNQFFGHTHEDHFHIYHDDNSKAIGHAYVSSSIVPINKNPAFRIYEYDINTYEITNYMQYYLNLTQVNLSNIFNYTLLYNAKNAYFLDDLSTQSWSNLVDKFISRSSLLDDYIYRYNAAYYPYNTPCNLSCQSNYICEINLINNCTSYNT